MVIQHFEAAALGRTMEFGRTKPILMECTQVGSDELVSFVVKLYSNVELTTRSLAREVFGSLLARHYRLSTPEIAIINVPQELLYDDDNSEVSRQLSNSLGNNFGSRYITGVYPFNDLVPSLVQDGIDIFSFDLLIQNYDRKKERPNLITSEDIIYVFDHEIAFPYAAPELLIGGNENEPGTINPRDPLVTGHVLYDRLSNLTKRKNADFTFDNFIENLGNMTDEILSDITDSIPMEWRSEELGRISSYLARVRENANNFERCLKEALA